MLQLEPYQEEGVQFLAKRKAAILADEMGLGKTAQTIRALNKLKARRALIVCPAIARINWQREFQKFCLDKAHTFVVEKSKDIDRWDKKSHIICSFNFAPHLLEFLKERSTPAKKVFNALIVDEAHFLKNSKTVRSKAVLSNQGLVRFAHRFWALTGTPMPNHPGELWLLLKVMGATDLKYHPFVKKYCNCYGGWDNQRNFYAPLIITGAKKQSIPELKSILSQVMLRRKLKDFLSLRSESQKFILPRLKTIPSDIAKLFTPEFMDEVKKQEEIAEFSIDSAESIMMQAASISSLRRYNGLLKVPGISELVAGELDSGAYEKIVIFCHHTDVMERLKIRFTRFHPLQIHGKISSTQRQNAIDSFQNKRHHRVLLASILAAGTAINLTKASQVLFAELDYVPANNQQAIRRVLRRGQQQKVFIRSVCLGESIDERITEILSSKLNDILQIVEGAKQ